MSHILDCAHPWLRSLHPYEPGKPIEDVARELGLDPAQIIKLASNENPLGPSPKAIEAMQENASSMHIYPDGGGWKLRTKLAEQLELKRENMVLGNGSNEIIELLGHCFAGAGRKTVASQNAFVVYELMTQLFGGEFHAVADIDFQPDLPAIAAACEDKRVSQVFLANPNNPTGSSISQQELDAFVEAVPQRVIIVLDEAYHEVSTRPLDSLKYLREGRKNVVVLRTFSKILGLAGLRIGYGMMHEQIAGLLQRARQPFNANKMAQEAALAALDDENHIQATQAMNHKGMAFWKEVCQTLNLRYLPSEGNFLMVQVGQADAIFQSMLKQGVIVRSLASYQLPEWIRITIGTEEQNQRASAVLENSLSSLD